MKMDPLWAFSIGWRDRGTGAEMESQHSDAINTHTGVCVCRRVRALGNINRQQVRSAPKDVQERGGKKKEEIGGHFYSVVSSGDARAICRRQIIHCAAGLHVCVYVRVCKWANQIDRFGPFFLVFVLRANGAGGHVSAKRPQSKDNIPALPHNEIFESFDIE
jgi:hypothetical protein